MPSLAGARTRLGVGGTVWRPYGNFDLKYAPITVVTSDTLSVSVADFVGIEPSPGKVYSAALTRLGVTGHVWKPYGDLTKPVGSLFELNVSDTLNVQWLEEPVDEQFVTTADTVRVGLSDIAALHNRIDAVDTLSVALSESIALVQVGVTLKTASDTLSVTLTEASNVHVTLDVADTLSASVTDTATVAVNAVSIEVTDTLSVSVDDLSLLQIFTGLLSIAVSDDVRVGLTDTSGLATFVPTKPLRIRVAPRTRHIRITPI